MDNKEFPEENKEENIIDEENDNNEDGLNEEIDFEKVVDDKDKKAKVEIRRISVPPHRLTPLRNNWEKIVTTIVENMGLQIRMNTKKKSVEIRNSDSNYDRTVLQRGADFLKSFMLGFDLNDAIALLRLDDLFLETFEIKDVKNLHGEHLSRCIARISGEKGKTKNAIENATRTRIVLADSKIHLLGSFGNIKTCRDAICSLILGSPPGKVYSQLRYISKRNLEKF